MIILTREGLTTDELKKITDIVNESRCIYESLRNTFPDRFTSLNGEMILFDYPNQPEFVANGFCYILERR